MTRQQHSAAMDLILAAYNRVDSEDQKERVLDWAEETFAIFNLLKGKHDDVLR